MPLQNRAAFGYFAMPRRRRLSALIIARHLGNITEDIQKAIISDSYWGHVMNDTEIDTHTNYS